MNVGFNFLDYQAFGRKRINSKLLLNKSLVKTEIEKISSSLLNIVNIILFQINLEAV